MYVRKVGGGHLLLPSEPDRKGALWQTGHFFVGTLRLRCLHLGDLLWDELNIKLTNKKIMLSAAKHN